MKTETTTSPSSDPVASGPAPDTAADPFAWMDVPGVAAPATGIKSVRSSKKLKEEQKRFKSMARQSVLGKARVWACDGEYIAYRANCANPATHERHQRFLAAGHYEHVETQDDVQIFKLLDGSPFKRNQAMILGDLSLTDVKRQAALAAVNRDWVAYTDILEELAGRYKMMYDPAFSKLCFDETMERLLLHIQQRGGPSPAECSAGMQNVRAKRGHDQKKIILIGRGKR